MLLNHSLRCRHAFMMIRRRSILIATFTYCQNIKAALKSSEMSNHGVSTTTFTVGGYRSICTCPRLVCWLMPRGSCEKTRLEQHHLDIEPPLTIPFRFRELKGVNWHLVAHIWSHNDGIIIFNPPWILSSKCLPTNHNWEGGSNPSRDNMRCHRGTEMS